MLQLPLLLLKAEAGGGRGGQGRRKRRVTHVAAVPLFNLERIDTRLPFSICFRIDLNTQRPDFALTVRSERFVRGAVRDPEFRQGLRGVEIITLLPIPKRRCA